MQFFTLFASLASFVAVLCFLIIGVTEARFVVLSDFDQSLLECALGWSFFLSVSIGVPFLIAGRR